MAPQIYRDPRNLMKKEYKYAIVGASNDKYKHGFQVYYKMKGAGYEVYPINPREKSVQDDPCFPNLAQLRPYPDVVILAVHYDEDESAGEAILREMRDTGFFRIWIEPECESDEMRHFIRLHHFDYIEGVSIIEEIERDLYGESGGKSW